MDGELEVHEADHPELLGHQPEHAGDPERDDQLRHLDADLGLAEAGRELDEALAVHQAHREDRAGLDDDVEDLRALAEPELLRDEKVSGRRDRQELGDPLDHAEQEDVPEVVHGQAIRGGQGRRAGNLVHPRAAATAPIAVEEP